MTGREPQTLLDSQTLTWQWQPYTRMSDQLANVFQKMLALHPGDRYQTAREAWADLQPLMEGAVEDTVLNSAPDIAPAARDIIETRVFTTIKSKLRMDAGKREPVDSATPRSMLRRLEASRARRKRGMAPGVAIATSLLVVAGIGTYLFKVTAPSQQSVLDGPRRSNPVLVSDGKARKIEFAAGDISKIEQGNLLNTNAQPYLLEARQGQIMTLTLEGAGVTMNILRANGQKIDSSAYQTRSWTGQLPADEEYMIQVTGSGGYWLDVAITPEASSPVSDFQRVKFARGKASTTVTGTLLTKRVRRYALTASTNQLMTIRVLKGNVNVVVNSPKGERIGSSSPNARYWQGKLKMAGEHIVEISALDKTDYALSLEIR
jgi:serine/threonine-protein kinase